MITISIVIPHYNSARLLGKLLDSIPPDSEKLRYEIIVIDDNSDLELDVLDACMEQYSYRNLIYKKNPSLNRSAGACRNIGLEIATGKWILFADSDDFFVDGWENAILPYIDTDNDVVFFPPTSLYLDTGEESDRHVYYAYLTENYLNNPNRENELKVRLRYYSPCSKLYRRYFLQEFCIRFEEIPVANDVLFSTKVGVHLQKFQCSEATIYCIIRRAGSLTTLVSKQVYDTRLNAYINAYLYIRDNIPHQDFQLLYAEDFGRGILCDILSKGYGVCLAWKYYMVFRKNHVPVLPWKFANPFWLFPKILSRFISSKKTA